MTLRLYLVVMILTTLVCWIAWLYTVFTVDPDVTNWIGFLLFYVSLFLSIVGTAAITGFLVRFIVLRQRLLFNSVKEAFRQSFLFAILIIISLVLLSRDLFTWMNLSFLVVGLSVLEFFLLEYDK